MRKLLAGFLAVTAWAAAGAPREEHVRYMINWPSGISLGEGELRASRDGDAWNFELNLDASIPGFELRDRFRSASTAAFCALSFEKDSVHGSRKRKETTTFTPGSDTAVRKTGDGGGKSDLAVPACAQDALTFLFRMRDEIKQGRVPAPQQIFFGAPYDIRTQSLGLKRIVVSDVPTDTDQYRLTVKGKASQVEFDVFFARDEKRTLALVKVPLAMGSFSLEWAR